MGIGGNAGRKRWRAGLAALSAAGALWLAAPALALGHRTWYASPNGSGKKCTQEAPCDIQTAVEQRAVTQDEVVLRPGEYLVGDDPIEVTSAIAVHGKSASSRPRIVSTANVALSVNAAGARIRDVEISHAGGTLALGVSHGTVERVVAESSSTYAACAVGDIGTADAVLRDSVCWSMSSTGAALRASIAAINPYSVTGILRNVTAIASGASGQGILAFAGGNPGVTVLIDAQNVIASGGAADVAAESGAGASATVNLDHSNYATQSETSDTGTGATVTDPGTGTNQTAEPLFADAAGGDFHQAPGSPTIDAGGTRSQLGSKDFDGEPRVQGPAPDIGADEFHVAPDTEITRGPPKKTTRRKAKLEFTSDEPNSTFECKLDREPFEPCESPERLRGLGPGKHVFRVRATDPAGNTDPTPAKRKWRVLS